MAEFVQCDGQANYCWWRKLCLMLTRCNPKVHGSFFTKIELKTIGVKIKHQFQL